MRRQRGAAGGLYRVATAAVAAGIPRSPCPSGGGASDPFGSRAAVWDFNRPARALRELLVRLLELAATNYYDDFTIIEAEQLAEITTKFVDRCMAIVGWDIKRGDKDMDLVKIRARVAGRRASWPNIKEIRAMHRQWRRACAACRRALRAS